MFRLVCLLLGYIIGCVQIAYFTGKVFGNIDIREYGSGNAGTTNVLRTLGKKAGLIVFIGDVLKAILAFIVASIIFNGNGTFISGNGTNILPGIYCGFGAVLGHCYPFYMKFKGGKGVACILGIILSINFGMALTMYAFGVSILIYKRYISAASLAVCAIFPFFLYLYNYDLESIVVSILLSALCFYLHRGNLKRIINGTERTITLNKKGEGENI